MPVPPAIQEIKEVLWREADRLYWSSLSLPEKSRHYEIWTESADIGGRLATMIDPRMVRVYIKDTLLKPYTRERIADPAPVFRLLRLPLDTLSVMTYVKPHGRRLADGREIAWSRATEWKSTLMGLFERTHRNGGEPFGVIFFDSLARHADPVTRELVEAAAVALRVRRVIWME